MKLLLATILALSLHSLFATAAQTPCPLVTKEMPDHSIVITNCRGESVVEPAPDAVAQPPATLSATTPPSAARRAQDEYEVNYWKYNSESLALRHRVFRQQFYISGAIFLLVIALVGVGVYFAFVQFQLGKIAGNAAMERTDLELGASGLKISSSVLGLLVLALSMGFFFLYLKYVYPISVLNPAANVSQHHSE